MPLMSDGAQKHVAQLMAALAQHKLTACNQPRQLLLKVRVSVMSKHKSSEAVHALHNPLLEFGCPHSRLQFDQCLYRIRIWIFKQPADCFTNVFINILRTCLLGPGS